MYRDGSYRDSRDIASPMTCSSSELRWRPYCGPGIHLRDGYQSLNCFSQTSSVPLPGFTPVSLCWTRPGLDLSAGFSKERVRSRVLGWSIQSTLEARRPLQAISTIKKASTRAVNVVLSKCHTPTRHRWDKNPPTIAVYYTRAIPRLWPGYIPCYKSAAILASIVRV